jgi:hypothetical protein
MDSLKIKTLTQVDDALEIVEIARADSSLSRPEKLKLEKAALKLRNLERAIIRSMQNELVDSLKADSEALDALSDQIKGSSEKLAGVADTVKKAAGVVESFVKIITTVAASGLL